MSERDWQRQRLERERDRGETGDRDGLKERGGGKTGPQEKEDSTCGCAQHPHRPLAPLSLGPRAGKCPGWAARGAHSGCPRALAGMVWGACWRGEGAQEAVVAGGSRKEAGNEGFPKHREGRGSNSWPWGGGGSGGGEGPRIKETLFSVLGHRQLPPPRSCQGRPPLLASPLVCGPRPGLAQPPRPQTTGSFSAASSDLGAPDLGSVPSRVSCRDAHTVPFFPAPSPRWRRAGPGAASAWPAAPLPSRRSAA